MNRIPLLVIAGPTGTGKTATAVALARRLPIEVVSADSRQVYRSMDTATGKPSAAERRAVRHHLIDVIGPDERYDAARFCREASQAIEDIHARGQLPVVVGGTGLYIRALLRGLDPAPPADHEFRRELELVAAREGGLALHERLGQEAPELAQRLHPNDRVRIVRALELVRAGSPIGAERQRWQMEDDNPYQVVYVGVTMARETLAQRLRSRVLEMVAAGLEDEVRDLLARGHASTLPAMLGIGYRQFVRVVHGTLAVADAIRLMQRDTMKYAKRQWTWFKREPPIVWLDIESAGGTEGGAKEIERMVREAGLAE